MACFKTDSRSIVRLFSARISRYLIHAYRAIFFLLMIAMYSNLMQAQQFSGEFELTGVHEMAGGFKFLPDGHFGFYFIYGAVDRTATGTYTIEGSTLRLKSDKTPGADFEVLEEKHKGKGYTLVVQNENPILASNVRCIYFVNAEQREAFTDDNGVIRIAEPACEKIYVQHALFPDIATLIKDEHNKNNYFELSLAPDIQSVSFKGIDFTIDGDTLTCPSNYFMQIEHIRFVKVK